MPPTTRERIRMDRAYHDAIGNEYDRVILQPRQTASAILFEKLTEQLPTGERMLDVGCGTGQAVCRFGHKVGHITAIDHSLGMLEKARENSRAAGLNSVEFIQTDVLDWLDAEQTEQFDIITAIGFLHHLTDKQVLFVLERISGKLVPGGRILIADPVDMGNSQPPSLIRWWNQRSLAAHVGYTEEPPEPDERPLPLELMNEAFANAGLRPVAEAGSWEIFNRTSHPGAMERLLIRLLYHLGGKGVVRAWLLASK